MDASVQLALMTKAKRVFESENTFLSFPVLSPLSYPPDRLKFGTANEITPQALLDLSEFARIVNQIPHGVLAPVEEDEYLWDIYQEVLQTAQLSAGSMPPEEKVRYDRAMAFLYTSSSEGRRQPSGMLTTYFQYRDAHIKAQEEYKNRQLTAELSADPTVQDRWRDIEEPFLRQEVQRVEQEWLTQGFKVQVEEAQQVEQACKARAPSVTWGEWKESFIVDLDTATDTNQTKFAMTGFSPSDLFDAGSWPRFAMSSAEMTQLIRQAPRELQAIFGSDMANASIDSVSFEYRSVALARPWLRPALFKSRFWRLGAAGGELSNGSNPPQGRCPAYITALVFARNVTIQRRQQTDAPAEKLEKPGTLLMLDPNIVPHHPRLVRDPALLLRRVPMAASAAVQPLGVAQPHATAVMPASPAAPSGVVNTATIPVASMPIETVHAHPLRTHLLESHTFHELKRVSVPVPAPATVHVKSRLVDG